MTDLTEIQKLLSENKKIQAIKTYREQTGKSLKEAKEAIEQWEQRGIEEISSKNLMVSNVHTEEIEELILDGNIIKAIKTYREQTGKSLKEAKEAIEKMEVYKESHKSGVEDTEITYPNRETEESIQNHQQADQSELEKLNEQSVHTVSSNNIFSKVILIISVILGFILSVFALLFYLGKF